MGTSGGTTRRANYESVWNSIDCPERVDGLLGTEPLPIPIWSFGRCIRRSVPRSLLLVPVPN